MKRARALAIAGLSLFGALTAGSSHALAQGGIPNCEELEHPIYLGGTTAVLPVIRLFGARLRQVKVTLLWNENSEGCGSVGDLVIPPTTVSKARTVYSQYTEVGSGPNSKIIITTCNAKAGQTPDLVINDTNWTSCGASYNGAITATGVQTISLPPDVKEFLGPVQGLVPIVAGSYLTYSDILETELFALYACGGAAKILTFTESATIFDFNCLTSGMRELWARGIGASNAGVFRANVGGGCNTNRNAESVVSEVATSGTPDSTIGYTSTEFYDANRDKVRALAVRGVNGQIKAYLPDSSAASIDKINLREGRYTIQSPLKLVAKVDSSGVPINANARLIIDWMLENPLSDPALTLPFDLNEIYAQRGVVPQCAMRVIKNDDSPIFKHYKHPRPCHCSFEMQATGKSSCKPCVDPSTCEAGQQCTHGYCE
jgi:hypothetical protein